MYNLLRLKMTHAKSSKPARMFQWNADLGGQNVLTTLEMAIRHNRRTTRTELERVFCRWIYFHLRSKILSGPLTGGGAIAPIVPYGSATVLAAYHSASLLLLLLLLPVTRSFHYLSGNSIVARWSANCGRRHTPP